MLMQAAEKMDERESLCFLFCSLSDCREKDVCQLARFAGKESWQPKRMAFCFFH